MVERLESASDLHSSRPTWGSRLVVTIAIALVLFPWLGTEISAWYAAAAEENELDGDVQAALDSIDRAISWNPSRAGHYLLRARYRVQSRQFDDALADCQRAMDLQPERRLEVLRQRFDVYQRQGRHDLALADANAIVASAAEAQSRDVDPPLWAAYDDALNLRAYARALAGKEIKAGLEDIDTALAMQPADNSSFLDTRGYLRLLDGDVLGALVDMERAIELEEARSEQIASLGHRLEPRDRKIVERQHREHLAVMYQHRGLVYQQLELKSEAEDDLQRAEDFGYSQENGVW